MDTPVKLIAAVCASAIAASGHALHAEEIAKIGFDRIWELVRVNSHTLSAASSDESAAKIAGDRLAHHWLPNVYADARGYVSNDPGAAFMSKLGQRSVNASDFAPGTLNRPGTGIYQKAALGAELPVYEGGAPSAYANAAEKEALAKREMRAYAYLAEFTGTASVYGRLIVLRNTASELTRLQTEVAAVLDNYQGGLNANPVEYSGILGLKALKNRIAALSAENSAAAASSIDFLNSAAGSALSGEWAPDETDALHFADVRLASSASGGGSHAVKAMEFHAEGTKSRADGASAVFLPKIALFSEADIYSGKRDTADAYSAGFYVRMNLVSPTDYGAVGQAKQESRAAAERAKDAQRREQIELRRLARMAETLASNIATLRESAAIMDEQLKTTRKLFSAGAVKSFQLADVFARKADLVMNLSQAEESYVAAKSGIYAITGKAEDSAHE